MVEIHFAARECQSCGHRSECTKAKVGGRKLTVRPEAQQAALEAA
ncbi:MAG: hypothetical protein C4321_08160, partial [Chloroflexota bacterium]